MALDLNAFARGMQSVPQIDITAGPRQETANLMNMIKVKQMQDEQTNRNALRNAYAGINYNNITGADLSRVGQVDPGAVPKLMEMQEAQRKAVVRNIATALLPVAYDATDDNLARAAKSMAAMGVSPDQIRSTFEPIMAAPMDRRGSIIAMSLAGDPQTLEAFKMGLPKTEKRSDGQQEWIEDVNPLSPGFGSRASVAQMRVSPDTLVRVAAERARLAQDKAELDFKRNQPPKPADIKEFGGEPFTPVVVNGETMLMPSRIIVDGGVVPAAAPGAPAAPAAGAPATPGAPAAGVPAMPGAPAAPAAPAANAPAAPAASAPTTMTYKQMKSRDAAFQVLDVFGYDPETGASRLEDLIAQTSSGLGETGKTAILSLAGQSTPQSRALIEIEGMMTGMVAMVTDNKLGAQVSNTDRDFLKEQYGKFNDTKKPIEDRLAAADAAFRRLNKMAGNPQRAPREVPSARPETPESNAARRPGQAPNAPPVGYKNSRGATFQGGDPNDPKNWR